MDRKGKSAVVLYTCTDECYASLENCIEGGLFRKKSGSQTEHGKDLQHHECKSSLILFLRQSEVGSGSGPGEGMRRDAADPQQI